MRCGALQRKNTAILRQWRPIAAANNITNPRVLDPGTELIIPSI